MRKEIDAEEYGKTTYRGYHTVTTKVCKSCEFFKTCFRRKKSNKMERVRLVFTCPVVRKAFKQWDTELKNKITASEEKKLIKHVRGNGDCFDSKGNDISDSDYLQRLKDWRD